MGFSYNVNVLNQKGSPALYTDTFANRPAAGYAGRLFIANDTSAIYEDTGTAWVLIANVSSGAGTLQQVTTNGNTSNVGISVTAGGISTNSLIDTALTLGSIPFTGAGGLISQDNANFFWDDTNNRLGINTNTPGNSLDVHTAGTNPTIAINNTAGNQSVISFLNTSVAKWRIGNTATTNTFDIFNFGLSTNAIKINNGDNSIDIPNIINVQSNGSTFGTSANGATPVFFQANNGFKVMQLKNIAGGTANINLSGTASTSIYGFDTFSTINAFSIENNGDTKTKSISYAEEFILNSATYGILAALTRNLTAPGIGILQLKNSAFAYIQPTTLTVDRTYTLPDATGTIALTSNLSSYVPYTGATTDVNLSANSLFANRIGIGATITNGNLVVKSGETTTSGIVLERQSNTDKLINIYSTTANGKIAIASGATTNIFLDSLGSSYFNGGSLGLGTITPSTILEIVDTSANDTTITLGTNGETPTIKAGGTNTDIKLESVGAGGNIIFTTNASVSMYVLSTGVVRIINLTGTGSRAVLADASGNLSAPVSDETVKENIQPLQYGLNAIMQLNPISFEYIDEYKNYGEGLQIGNIAQDVAKVIPEAVFTTPSTGLMGINYNQFDGIYIKAIQDLNNIIDGLLKRIELLENK